MKAWVGGSHTCAWLPSSFCGGCIIFVSSFGSGHCCSSPLLTAFTVFLGQDCACGHEESRKWALSSQEHPFTHSFWSFRSVSFLHDIPSPQSLVLLVFLLLFSRIHYHMHFLSCVRFSCYLVANAGAQLQVIGGAESSLNCPVGRGVCCLPPSELAVRKLLWSRLPTLSRVAV